MEGSRWGLRGEQEGAGVGGHGGGSAALEPEKRERGGMRGQCHGIGEMAAAKPWNGVARPQEGQGGKARAALGLGSTRGEARNWRWRRGAAEAQHLAGVAALTSAAEVQRAKQRNCQRRKKREGGPRGPIGKAKTSGTSL
jgi:hypothetical protein